MTRLPAPRNLESHALGDLLLVCVTLLAAGGWIFSREAVAGFEPLLFMGMRFGGAGLILVLIGRKALLNLDRHQWRAALQVGLLFGIAMSFWVMGLKLTSHVGVGAFLNTLGLVLVPLLSLLFGDRPGRWVYLSLPFAIAGLGCLSLDTDIQLGVAEGCFLTAAFIIGLIFIVNGRAATRIPALPLTAIQLTVTGIITGVLSLLFEHGDLSQPPAIWGWLLASMLIATALRFLLQTRAQGMAPPSHGAIIMTLEPVWTAMLAMAWLGERMTGLQVAGCALIFAAMLVNRWPAVRQWLKQVRRGSL